MEEAIWSLIFHGCKLARDLELNLPNLANQPENLSQCFDEIITVFSNARDQFKLFNAQLETTNSIGYTVFQELQEREQWENMAEGVQEWLRPGSTEAMDLIQEQTLVENVNGMVDSGRDRETSAPLGGGGGEVQVPSIMDVFDSGRSGSSSQRQRRRKDEAEKRTLRMAAPMVGNTEIPPEDGYTWRKYGQKEILGARFQRSYYRCTRQKLYQCPAKKQVQRLDEDPYTFQVTYRGNHTCTMSLTSPSMPPPTSMEITTTTTTQEMNQHFTATTTTTTMQPPLLPPSTSVPLSQLLSMDINKNRSERFSNFINMEMYSRSSSSSSMVDNSGAGPSTVHYRSEVDQYQPVIDLADAMFNSGSGSNNSMELIFSTMEENKEAGDKKN